jgi:hypothetical protein
MIWTSLFKPFFVQYGIKKIYSGKKEDDDADTDQMGAHVVQMIVNSFETAKSFQLSPYHGETSDFRTSCAPFSTSSVSMECDNISLKRRITKWLNILFP